LFVTFRKRNVEMILRLKVSTPISNSRIIKNARYKRTIGPYTKKFDYELVHKRLIKSTKLIHLFNELSELHNWKKIRRLHWGLKRAYGKHGSIISIRDWNYDWVEFHYFNITDFDFIYSILDTFNWLMKCASAKSIL